MDVSEWVDLDTRCGSGWGGAWSDLDGTETWTSWCADQDRPGPSRLYENLGVDGEGRWRFEDRSETCLCAHQAGAMGVSPGTTTETAGWISTSPTPAPASCSGLPGRELHRHPPLGAEALTDEAAMSFGSVFADLDQDGWLDIALAAGPLSANAPIASQPQEQADVLLMGSASGFTDVSEAMGFGNLEAGQGSATAISTGTAFRSGRQPRGALGIFEAQCTEARSLQVSLQGRIPTASGWGPGSKSRPEARLASRITSSAGHASVIHPRAWFGLGQREQLIVRWPDGLIKELGGPNTWSITVERP